MLKRIGVSALLLISIVFAQWTETEIVPDGRLQEISILDDGTAYIAIGNQTDIPYGGVLKTTDWGTSWTELDCPAATTPTGMLSVDFWDVNLGIVTGKDHVVMITRDGGATWETPAFEAVNSFWVSKWLSATTVITVGDSGKVFISEDAGVNWTSSRALVNVLQTIHSKAGCYDMEFLDDNTWVSVGKKGAIAKTTDAGATWTILPQGLGTPVFLGIDAIDVDNWMIVGTNGSALKTTDGGANFTTMTLNSAARFESLDYLDANNAMAGGNLGSGSPGVIYQTTDGGATWTEADIPSTTSCTVREIHMYDATTVIALGDLNPGGRIYQLGDPSGGGGGNNAPVANAGADQTFDVAAPNQSVFVTLDGSGSSDSDGSIVSYDWAWEGGSASGVSASSAFEVGTYTVTLTVTDDSSATDTDDVIITINPYNAPTADFSASVTEGLAPLEVSFTDLSTAGASSIIGWSWDFNNDGTEDSDVQNPSYTFSEAGTYSVSLTVRDLAGASVTVTKADYILVSPVSIDGRLSPQTFALHTNYPNPFNPSTQLSYDLAESGVVELTIYDVNGNEISKLVQGYQTAGSYTLTFSATNMPLLRTNVKVNAKKPLTLF